jgi:hypothetical protein
LQPVIAHGLLLLAFVCVRVSQGGRGHAA